MMDKRKWTTEEINEYRKNNGAMFYYNKEDANLFIPRTYGFGWTLNWAHPVSWVLLLIIIGLIIYRSLT